jgi:hypothetical protein
MESVLIPALVFLVANAVILLVVLLLNRRQGRREGSREVEDTKMTAGSDPGGDTELLGRPQGKGGTLPPADILAWEFEYARTTASEAMQDRLTMVNFYLLTTGVIASGVVFALGGESKLPGFLGTSLGTGLLWLLCGIGWIHFLKIIRLRQAWHDSAKTMNRIKEFYIERVEGIAPDVLWTAFRWRPETLPEPGKPWTLFFYSAVLIAFLNSAAYVSGGVLLGPQKVLDAPLVGGALLFFGLSFFALHIGLYFAFLPPEKRK